MTVSRWCAATEPEIWTELGRDGEPDEDFPVDPHRRCAFERRKGHDDECHRECCWGELEAESRDCTCMCHPSPESHEVIAVLHQDVPAARSGANNKLEIEHGA